MKILILTNYSCSICGVWSRAKQDAIRLAREGNEVVVFSSNATKGSSEIAIPEFVTDNILIRRFPYKKLGGESFMRWEGNWVEEAIALKPDLIIAHAYRHLHTTQALKIAKATGAKCWLVSHSPFGDEQRTFVQKMFVKLYDLFVGRRTINKFDKVITICKWENKYLEKLGLDMSKVSYEPIKADDAFYNVPIGKLGKRDVLFLGRISSVKDIPTLLRAALRLGDVRFSVAGPIEEGYNPGHVENVDYLPAVWDVQEKIKLIDSHKIFILPSIRESMPTSLVEALARKRIIIASDNPGNREVLEGQPNCYLFPIGDDNRLAKLIKENL